MSDTLFEQSVFLRYKLKNEWMTYGKLLFVLSLGTVEAHNIYNKLRYGQAVFKYDSDC